MLDAFGAFGFCKAHAAAFAHTAYQSAWLKTHHPAAFLAGVLTHDPGMYPKRLLLAEARRLGVPLLPLDVNRSGETYHLEVTAEGVPGIRLSLADVKGIHLEQVRRVVAARPYRGLADFWHRTRVGRDVVDRLVLVGAFDALHGLGEDGRLTHRDLLLQVADLERQDPPRRHADQLTLPLGAAESPRPSGLPPLTRAERVRAELDVLGMDASAHVVSFYAQLLRALGVVPARDLLRRGHGVEVLVAGVKVVLQTPPLRSGRRVLFLTLNDPTGPVDTTFFENVQDVCAPVVFASQILLVRGVTRRTGPRGLSVRATAVWDLPLLWTAWSRGGRPPDARDLLSRPERFG